MANPGLYTVGGTVQAGGGIYIPRQADQELLQLCREKVFAYVLTPRQMGKSSLMVQTAERLQTEGVRTAIVDLQDLGAQVTAEQWYFGFLVKLEDQLELETDVVSWWGARSHLGVSQRLTLFFEQVLLQEIAEPVVIFVDEIDSTLSLDFTDDFFIAIRSLYVTRATQPVFGRLSFVLIGVATPGDLIRDARRTPFNVGKRVDLTDFTLAEAMPLAAGLGLAEAAAEQALGWVLQWTGGHPYLTQRLCQEMAQVGGERWTEAEVERLVGRTFLGTQSEQDNNLQFVRDMLTKRAPEPVALLKTYRDIWRGRPPVVDEEQSLTKSHLKLAGVVKREGKALQVRNRVYRQVFDRRWIREHLPESWWQRLTPAMRWAIAGLLLLTILTTSFAIDATQQRLVAEQQIKIVSLREKATVVLNRLQTPQPMVGMVLAIQAMGEVIKQKPEVIEQVLNPVQSSLLTAVQTVKEQNLISHKVGILSVVFSPDGKTIATGGNEKEVRLWNLQCQPIAQSSPEHQAIVNSIAFNSNGKIIASGSEDKTVRLWNLQGQPIGQPLEGHQASVQSVAFSPDGEMVASGSDDKTVRLWDLQGQPIGQPFQGHRSYVKSIGFSPDGKMIASGSSDYTVRLWDLQGHPIGQPFQGHQSDVKSIAFSPDGKTIASGSYDNTVRLWTLEGQPIGQPFQGHTRAITSVAFSPDGKTIASGSRDNTVRLWTLEGQPIGQPFQGHTETVTSVIFSPNGKTIASGSRDNTVRLWDLQEQLTQQLFQGNQEVVRSVAFSSDGKAIASSDLNQTVRLWNLQGQPIGQPLQESSYYLLKSINFSPDGKIITISSDDGTAQLWDLQGQPIGPSFQEQPSQAQSIQLVLKKDEFNLISSFAFSPDGKTIVSGSWGEVQLWNLEGQPIGQPFQGHKYAVRSVAFSPDGKTIASAGEDKTLRLWTLEGQPIGQPFQGHKSVITSIAFSPDGKTIASGSGDNTVRLWDLQGQPIGQPFQGHQSDVKSVAFSPDVMYVAFSPDGRTIASGGKDKTVRLWIGNWEGWLRIACRQLRFHPVLRDPDNSFDPVVASGARQTCEEQGWGN